MSDIQKTPLNMGGHQVTNSADPTNPTDLVTKRWALANSVAVSGVGVPVGAPPNNVFYYFRSDTPATANQRIYVWNGTVWTGIL